MLRFFLLFPIVFYLEKYEDAARKLRNLELDGQMTTEVEDKESQGRSKRRRTARRPAVIYSSEEEEDSSPESSPGE